MAGSVGNMLTAASAASAFSVDRPKQLGELERSRLRINAVQEMNFILSLEKEGAWLGPSRKCERPERQPMLVCDRLLRPQGWHGG